MENKYNNNKTNKDDTSSRIDEILWLGDKIEKKQKVVKYLFLPQNHLALKC